MEHEYINNDNRIVKIDEVVPNDYNPKLHYDEDEHNFHEFQKIKDSIQKAGQIQPILVRELENGKFEIINGFHRWSAMKELEFEYIEIKNLGKLDFDTAVSRALLTEDTKVPIDKVELGNLFKRIVTTEKNAEYWADLLPYTPDLIKTNLELLDFDPNAYEGGEEGGNQSGSGYEDKKYQFFVPNEDVEMVERALGLSGQDSENKCFIEICRYYYQNFNAQEAEFVDKGYSEEEEAENNEDED